MATLSQYWNDESNRLTAALSAEQAALASRQAQLAAAQAALRAAADAVRSHGDAVAAARKALAAIAMPADGDPLLLAMEAALVAQAAARVTLATREHEVQSLRAAVDASQRRSSELAGELAAARQAQAQATQNAAALAAIADALTLGDLADLGSDAAAALTSHAATARARVEGEFPSSATAAESLLDRVRARRAIVDASLTHAATVETAAFAGANDALAEAQRAYEQARQAVVARHQAATTLAADTATLAQLAALPAAAAGSFPILTPWQHARLHDAARKAAREAALAKLTAVDDAQLAWRSAQAAYDQARDAAVKAEPDATPAQLDATTLNTVRTALDGKAADLATARAALTAGERSVLANWLAAVPDALWVALDRLDTALSRLTALKGPPSAADRLATLASAESAFAGALAAAGLARRQQTAANNAHACALAARSAETETQRQRAEAFARSAALF